MASSCLGKGTGQSPSGNWPVQRRFPAPPKGYPPMTLSSTHRDYLIAAAIRPEVIDASGITTREAEPTGILFPWNDGDGETLLQLRPDHPETDATGRPIKYRFPTGAKMILNRLRDSGEGPALIVEGTKQQYTALSYAPEEYAVYGLSGCWNWVDADLTWVMGREVYVLFDGDIATNKDVHQAAGEFAEKLELSGATSVKYVRTTARGTDGLDDVLAKVAEDKRAGYLELWLSKASDKLPKAPAAKSAPFFEKNGLQVQKATQSLLEKQPAALTAERKIALYLGGSFHIDGTAFLSAASNLLGDQYRPSWRAAMEEVATGMLFQSGKLLPERSSFAKLNCKNGMLDLNTLELEPHDPSFMSTTQIPVEWDPDARAPRYEEWLLSVCPLQTEDLEEVAGTMLDPTRTPHKAAFLFGPSRSGKSTMLRLLQAIAGVENRTAVTLHDLARDRFAAANVYGKILNSAADLSSAHVDDLSVFKMMTGEDPIHGNRKYGAQFTFTNQALFAFSANDLPTVSESSRAYAERIKPFHFPDSFAGREDPLLEGRLREELPGILVRWVQAYRRMTLRGGYLATDAGVRQEFETRSDRVAQWVAAVCLIVEATPGQNLPANQCTGRRESARAFNTWAERNGGSKMGERKIFDRLGHLPGICEVRTGRNRDRAFNIVVKDDPNSDLGFSPEAPKGRADRADSEHPPHTLPTPSIQSPEALGIMRGQEELYGEGAQKLPVLPALPGDFFEDPTPAPVMDHYVPPEFGGPDLDTPPEERPAAPTVMGFDLETASADQLFTGGHEGPFVRLVGLADDDLVTSDPSLALAELGAADAIHAHNLFGFDLLALARHHGADYDALAEKSWDTMVAEYLVSPPFAKHMPAGYYKLDTLAERYGVPGKTHDLMALARKHGGLDRIPLDDPDYNDYLRGDLRAQDGVYAAQKARVKELGLEEYAAREMHVAALQNVATLNGWAVDTALLAERVAHEDEQRAAAVKIMHEKYGVPLNHPDRFKLKLKREWPEAMQSVSIIDARVIVRDRPEEAVSLGIAERTPGEPRKSPWASDEGREAIVAAGKAAGALHWPRSPKGTPLTSADALGEKGWYDPKRKDIVKGLLQVYGDKPAVRELAETVALATGARVKYAELANHLTPHGRVHPSVGQAQG